MGPFTEGGSKDPSQKKDKNIKLTNQTSISE